MFDELLVYSYVVLIVDGKKSATWLRDSHAKWLKFRVTFYYTLHTISPYLLKPFTPDYFVPVTYSKIIVLDSYNLSKKLNVAIIHRWNAILCCCND